MIDKDELVFPSSTTTTLTKSEKGEKGEKSESNETGFTKSQLTKKTVPQLKTLCNKFQLPTNGNKPDLIERLLQLQPENSDSQNA